MKKHRIGTILSILLLAISAVGFTLWNINCPICQDDFYYRTIMQSDDQTAFSDCTGPRIETFGDALYSAWHVQLYEHGRWANVLHVLFTPFPTAVERIFTSLLLTFCIIILCRLSEGKKRQGPFAIATVTILLWTALPWYDSMASLAYQANYLWTSLTLLAYIYLLPAALRTEKRGRLLIFLGLCVVVAWGHEAFGITAGAYTVGLWPRLPQKDRRRTIGFIAALFAGFCIIMICGIGKRLVDMATDNNLNLSNIKYMLSRMASYSWPVITAYIFFIVRYLASKGRRKDYFLKSLPCILAMTASVTIVIVTIGSWGQARVLWPGIVMAILFIARNILEITARIPVAVKNTLSVVFAIAYVWWLVSLTQWQIRITEEYNTVYNNALALADSPTEVYMGSYTASDEVPFYLMGVVNNPLDSKFTCSQLTTSIKPRPNAQIIMAVDRAMTGPFDEWPEVPGNAGVRGVYPWIAVRDTSFHRIHVVLGPPPANKTPIDKLLIRLKYGPTPGNTEVDLNTDIFHKVFLADSSVVYRLDHEPFGRTLEGREVLRIDRADD